MKKLKTVLIGLGRIGWEYHLPKIARKDGFDLVGVADPLHDRLLEASQQYNVKGYLDYLDMLREQRPDLVVIASPTLFHARQAIASFEAGSHVFCEKPAGRSYEEFEDIFKASKSSGKKFMVYQPHRTYKEAAALKEILSRNKIGPIYMIRRNWFDYARRNDWQALKKFGGGMLNNYGSHFIDQLLYLTEYKAKVVSCITRNLVTLGDAEDFVKILLETKNKIILDIEINFASAHRLPLWQILGKYGSIVLDEKRRCWEIKYCRPEDFAKIVVNDELAAEGRKYYNGEIIDWIKEEVFFADSPEIDYYDKCYEFFALDKPAFVPIEQTRELMSILDCCDKIRNFSADAIN
jgi:scyllo-inositol 2-dehydrogenase (NADP+)